MLTSLLLPLLLPAGAVSAQDPVTPSPTVQTIEVPGTDTVLRLWRDNGGRHASVSRDGGRTFGPLLDPETELHLRFATFDPVIDGEPRIPSGLAAPSANRLYIVQFETQIIEEFKHDLKVLRAERYHTLPHQGFLVRMDQATARQVAEKPYVRWVGAYHPAYKLDPRMLDAIITGESLAPQTYDVVMVDDDTDRARTLAAIEDAGGVASPDSGQGIMQVATLTLGQAVALSMDETVMWINPLGKPEVDIDQARIQGGADYIESVAGFNGKGLTGMIMEGVYGTHVEFAATAPYRATPISLPPGNATAAAGSSHGTNTAGEVYAKGVNPMARGLTPFAQMLYCNYNYVFNNNNRKAVTQQGITQYSEMYETASWGYPRVTNYDSRSAEMDDIIFDLDVTITQSQSNSGSTPSRPQAWAKNIISGGAVMHQNTANPLDDGISGSSTGPSADGRIKPDLSGYYDSILTTSGSGSSYTPSFNGTSGATPIVNGYAGLTIQMFAEGHFGYPAAPGWQQLFSHKAHFSTIKALMVNTAYQYAFSQLGGAPRARYEQGWGFPDVKNMYDLRDKLIAVDEDIVLTQSQSRTYLVFVPANTPQLRATMVYSDPAGTTSATIHRINSVDLQARSPAGQTYWGNNGLLNGHFNTAGGVANDRDTVENVFVQSPATGVWVVAVDAAAVRQDGHVETGVDDVDFALVVSGIAGSRNQDHAVLDLTSTGPGNFGVSVTSLPAGWTEGFTVFSATTTWVPGNGNFLGVEADSLVQAGLMQPMLAGSVFHFNNTAGAYPNVPFAFPAPIANAVSGLTFDAMVMLRDASGKVIGVSNTDRVTVQ